MDEASYQQYGCRNLESSLTTILFEEQFYESFLKYDGSTYV